MSAEPTIDAQYRLPDHVVELMQPLGRKQSFKRGEALFQVGSEPDGLYGVLKGRFRSSAVSPEGKELLIALFEPGSWFGEISMFDGLGRTHTAHAVVDSELLIVPRHKFLELLSERPELNQYFYQMLCSKIRLCFSRIEDDYFQPVYVRLAKKLFQLARAYGVPTDEGTLIDLHLPQEELSQMVGAARPVINRELKNWEKEEMVSVRYGKLTIKDMARLEELTENACR